jgi:hypothetical protein
VEAVKLDYLLLDLGIEVRFCAAAQWREQRFY